MENINQYNTYSSDLYNLNGETMVKGQPIKIAPPDDYEYNNSSNNNDAVGEKAVYKKSVSLYKLNSQKQIHTPAQKPIQKPIQKQIQKPKSATYPGFNSDPNAISSMFNSVTSIKANTPKYQNKNKNKNKNKKLSAAIS